MPCARLAGVSCRAVRDHYIQTQLGRFVETMRDPVYQKGLRLSDKQVERELHFLRERRRVLNQTDAVDDATRLKCAIDDLVDIRSSR